MKTTLLLAALLIGGAAQAQEVPGLYITGDGGASFLPDLHVKNTTSGTLHENFDPGYAAGGALGYDTGNGVRLEIDSNYTLNNLAKVDGSRDNGHLDSTSVMVNGQVDLTHNTGVTPYVGAGIGYENVGVNADGVGGRDWKPAYQAEAGLRSDVSDRVSVFGEYRFTQSAAADIQDGNPQDAHQHFSDHGLLAGLTYHMGG
jgi:opacity protein-like surface antigen